MLSEDYTAVDYSPNMIDAFRRSFPGLPAYVTDARRMVEIDSGRYGLVLFSSPFQLSRPTRRMKVSLRDAIVAVGRHALDPPASIRRVKNWRRNCHRSEDHGTWAVSPLAAHDFGPIMHFTSLHDLRLLIHDTGFDVAEIYGDDGVPIGLDVARSQADNFTVVARPRVAAAPVS